MCAMAEFTSRSSTFWLLLMIAVALSAAARALEFMVEPTDQTVAPNSPARFECVVSGRNFAVQWVLDNESYTKMHPPEEEYYSATWYTNNSGAVLEVKAPHNKNGTSIMCRAINAKLHKESEIAHLNVAGPPLRPGNLKVTYDKLRHSVELKWSEPFTHLPQFPILGYQAHVELFAMEDQSIFKRRAVDINDTVSAYSVSLDESEICSSSRVCIGLRAINQIGYGEETKTACTNIERVHNPLPVNTSLSLHSDGQTLVSVIFQVPPCFPQAMQSTVFVEEAHLPQDSELTPEPGLPEEGAHLMESYALTHLKQDVVYAVVVQLKSHMENATSQPVYVTLLAEATSSDDGGGGGVAGIVVAVLLSVLVVAALVIAFAIFVIMHGRRKDTTVVNQMHPNPFYENTYYDSIPDPNSPPSFRPPSYDSHIYQDLPELVCRLQTNGNLPTPSLSQPLSSCVVQEGTPSLEEMKRVQTVVAEAVGERERESEYITMHSVTEPVPVLQTEI